MSVITMKQLLEAGVHFGHQTRKWNPKMRRYIYGERNDIHIINLEQTVDLIENDAYPFVVEAAKQGKTILFVGTKKQAQDAVKEEAERCGMYYINSRWLGGTLTNFKTIRSRVDRLYKLEAMEKNGEFDYLPKKEVAGLKKEMGKLSANLGGIKEMKALPGVMFVVDPNHEHIAIKEARKLHIPIVAITDTNCDPDLVDHVIPGNDDAIRAVKLIAGVIADAVVEANQGVSFMVAHQDEKEVAEEKAPEITVEEPVTEKTEEVPVAEPVEEDAEEPKKAPRKRATKKVVEEEVAGDAE